MHRLLIVEDQEAISFAMKRYLERAGFQVDVAADYSEAVGFIEREKYALVVSDMKLSGTSDTGGLDLVSLVKGTAPETRAVLLTAFASESVEREGKERGASVVLRKPVPLARLAEVLQQQLAEGVR